MTIVVSKGTRDTLASWSEVLKVVAAAQEMVENLPRLQTDTDIAKAAADKAKKEKASAEKAAAAAKETLEATLADVEVSTENAKKQALADFNTNKASLDKKLQGLQTKAAVLEETVLAKQAALDNLSAEYDRRLVALEKVYTDKVKDLQAKEDEITASIADKESKLQALQSKILKLANL